MHTTLACSLKLFLAVLTIAICESKLWSQSDRQNDKGPTATSIADSMRDDAMLHDVTFVDAEYGWAVGDRGVILHTSDGGRTWPTAEVRSRCFVQIASIRRPPQWLGRGRFD